MAKPRTEVAAQITAPAAATAFAAIPPLANVDNGATATASSVVRPGHPRTDPEG